MSVILQPNGKTLARRAIVPLTARQVTWFVDPQALLRHLDDLRAIKLAAYCERCYKQGLPEAVRATFSAEKNLWQCACACSDYPPLKVRGQTLEFVTMREDGTEQTRRIYMVDDLLAALGWSFKCGAECAKLGMHDGVEGNNDPRSHEIEVSCGCTVRKYREPVA